MNECYDVKLDKDVWPTCDYCAPICKNCVYCIVSDTYEFCRECKSNNRKKFSQAKGEFFCSHCGRPIVEGAWTMLEERLSMGVILLDELKE